MIAALSGRSIAKGIIAALIGILLSAVGTDPMTSDVRYCFGLFQLEDGVAIIPMVIGLFAVSELLAQVERVHAGTEAALELAMQGKQVTLVEMGIDVARDANSIHKPALMMELKDHAEQVTILRRTTCTGIHDHGIVCRDADGKELTLDADTVILAAGMAPLRAEALALEPLSSEFRMVGDCKRPRQILEAVREGYDAAMEV